MTYTVLDTTIPTVAITAPMTGETFTSSSITVTGTASDDVGVTTVRVRLNSDPWQLATGTTSWTRSMTLISSGSNTIEAQSFDAANNPSTVASVTVTYTPSATSPVVIYQESLNPAWIDASWSATNTFTNTTPVHEGIRSIKTILGAWGAFRVHSGTWSAPVAFTPAQYSAVELAIYNPLTSSITVLLSLSNDAGAFFPSKSVALSASAWTVVSATMLELNPGNLGAHMITVFSNTATSRTLYLDDFSLIGIPLTDTTAPTVTIETPTSGQILTSRSLTITGTATDNVGGVGVNRVNVRLNGSSWQTVSGSTIWTSSGIPLLLVSGANTIEAQAFDHLENASTVQSIGVTFTDTSPPTITLMAPEGHATFRGSVILDVSAVDDLGVAGVQFEVDGASMGDELSVAPYRITWDTLSVSDGPHLLRIIARDFAGNAGTLSVDVTVNNTTTETVGDLVLFDEFLSPEWTDASFGANVTFTNLSPVSSGVTSIKVVQRPGGALSLLRGSWDTVIPLDPARYTVLSFRVYGSSAGIMLAIGTGGFATVYMVGAIPVGLWISVIVPMSWIAQVPFSRVDIGDRSGRTKTFYVDQLVIQAVTP